MPYAMNGGIFTEPKPGAIRITDAQYTEALAGMQAGKIVTIDGGFAVIDPPQPEREPEPETEPIGLAAYAADARWRKENGGFILGGLAIATDDRSKIMIMGARIKADQDATFSTRWKMPDGTFVAITAETITAISDAVLDHVDACFALEGSVLAAIASGEITSAGQIENAFFPPSGE